ncbi:MAG TPA: hypothetical protein VMF04_02380 [Thermoplasmata archaeon]|nr:hypothetical protein [Thermoplasmata archaeon]
MAPPKILVVGETPSLGRAIFDVLDAYGIESRYTIDLAEVGREGLREVSVVVAASNSGYCSTLREQEQGRLNMHPLVVVGSRDPKAVAGPKVFPVGLPIEPVSFVQLIRSLL